MHFSGRIFGIGCEYNLNDVKRKANAVSTNFGSFSSLFVTISSKSLYIYSKERRVRNCIFPYYLYHWYANWFYECLTNYWWTNEKSAQLSSEQKPIYGLESHVSIRSIKMIFLYFMPLKECKIEEKSCKTKFYSTLEIDSFKHCSELHSCIYLKIFVFMFERTSLNL